MSLALMCACACALPTGRCCSLVPLCAVCVHESVHACVCVCVCVNLRACVCMCASMTLLQGSRGWAPRWPVLQQRDSFLQMKTGPFAEHSNQLWNISAVPSWSKVNQGLIRMYKAEVSGACAALGLRAVVPSPWLCCLALHLGPAPLTLEASVSVCGMGCQKSTGLRPSSAL